MKNSADGEGTPNSELTVIAGVNVGGRNEDIGNAAAKSADGDGEPDGSVEGPAAQTCGRPLVSSADLLGNDGETGEVSVGVVGAGVVACDRERGTVESSSDHGEGT